ARRVGRARAGRDRRGRPVLGQRGAHPNPSCPAPVRSRPRGRRRRRETRRASRTCRLYHSRTGGTTMKTDASLARLEGLVPVRDEALVREAQPPASLELLHRIVATPLPPASARRAPRRRVRVALPALAVAVAAVALAVTFSGGGHGTESAAAATLRKAANV